VCKVVEGSLGVDVADALYHSLNGNLSQTGVNDRIIDHFIGQQSKEMRRRYQHLFPEEKRKALRRLGYGELHALPSALSAPGKSAVSRMHPGLDRPGEANCIDWSRAVMDAASVPGLLGGRKRVAIPLTRAKRARNGT